jgi:hypothetical protein
MAPHRTTGTAPPHHRTASIFAPFSNPNPSKILTLCHDFSSFRSPNPPEILTVGHDFCSIFEPKSF